MARDTLENQWLSYYSVVVPENASRIQVDETKQAFYAGAHAAMSLLKMAAALDDPAATSAKVVELQAELDAYIAAKEREAADYLNRRADERTKEL